jgi:hypothetical protein
MKQPKNRATREQRHSDGDMPVLMLKDLAPSEVVAGDRLDHLYATEEVSSCGIMRETCPVCNEAHLRLVLRQNNVRVSHLYCPHCSRCFDACYPDGTSALT